MANRLMLDEQETVKALLATGLSPTAIAAKLGRDHKTILTYSRRQEVTAEVAELKQDLAESFEGLARRMVDSITDEDITKINAYQRTVAAGISVDKQRLLTGASTENVSVRIARAVRDLADEDY